MPPLPLGGHGRIRFYPHPHPDGPRWRATCKVRDIDGVTRPVSRIGKSKAAAERALQAALRDRHLSSGGDPISPDSRFSDAADLWLAEVRRLRADTTFDTYRRHLTSRILPALGELRLRELTVPVVHRYLRSLEQNLSPNTVRTCRNVVSGALSLAVQHGAIPANPVRDAGRIEGRAAAARALTREEREDFLRRLDADERAVADGLPHLVRWMLGTGCRIGETLALRWGQVDLDAGEALVGPTLTRVTGKGLVVSERGKTRAALRLVPLPDFVRLMLRLRLPDDVDPHAPVFPNTLGGWRDPNNTQRSLRKARTAAGYDWVTSHVFRKTAVTILDEHGLTPREIAGHVGHSRPSITLDTYMDLRARGRSAAEALDAALGPDR